MNKLKLVASVQGDSPSENPLASEVTNPHSLPPFSVKLRDLRGSVLIAFKEPAPTETPLPDE